VTLKTRPVAAGDLELICDHRERLFRESNAPGRTEEIIETQTEHYRKWLAPRLSDGTYFGYIIEDGDKPIAGIGLLLIDWPPHPSHPTADKRGYVSNVFVEPTHRRMGLAKMLMDMADAEFRRRGIGFVALHATRMARPLYEQLGWATTNEMTKTLR
jgi:GNAT superfamily N-acetyltransferase